MSQNAELQKAKDLIRKFSARTVDRGCSESEMKMAMDKVGQLLKQYNLHMSEIDLRDEPCIQAVVDTKTKQKPPAGKTVVGIAEFCGVKVWSSRSSSIKYYFYGMESDVEMAVYLYRLIETAMATELAAFKKTPEWINAYPRKGASVSFNHGMGSRIYRRLLDMKAANDLDFAARAQEQQKMIGSNVTSLVIIKENIVNAAMKAKYNWIPKARAGGGRVTNDSAWGHGSSAGGRVNLSRPLTGGASSGPKLIGSR